MKEKDIIDIYGSDKASIINKISEILPLVVDYESDEEEFIFLGRNKKRLLKIRSRRPGAAHNFGVSLI